MERIRGEKQPRAVDATYDDVTRQLAVTGGMLVFLVGLALLFVANAPS